MSTVASERKPVLTDRQIRMLALRNGTLDGRKHTHTEIGEIVGLPPERVRQIIAWSRRELNVDPYGSRLQALQPTPVSSVFDLGPLYASAMFPVAIRVSPHGRSNG